MESKSLHEVSQFFASWVTRYLRRNTGVNDQTKSKPMFFYRPMEKGKYENRSQKNAKKLQSTEFLCEEL
jgi:hypothetical protein